MNISDEIIKTALLGTSKYQPIVHSSLMELHSKIVAAQQDKEDAFLRYAAATLLYEECGREPLEMPVSITECPVETQQSMFPKTAEALKIALEDKDHVLIDYILLQATSRKQVAPPALAPMLLNRALENKAKRQGLLQLGGVTAKWLMGLNPAWKPLEGKAIEEDEQWETANHETRKQLLAGLRSSSPAEAIPLLQAAFPQENANNREEFVRLLETGLSPSDAPFLEAQLGDKSKKVKETAMGLLKQVRGGRIHQLFLEFVRRAFVVKDERYMIFAKRKVLEIDRSAAPQPIFFDCLVTKVSSQKGVSDQLYWLAQAVEYLHPDDWMPALGFTPADLIAKIAEIDEGGLLIQHLLRAAVRYQHQPLAMAFLAANTGAQIALLRIVSQEEGLPFHGHAMEANIENYIEFLTEAGYHKLRTAIAIKVLQSLQAAPYRIQQPGYRRLALHLPAEVQSTLEAYASESGHENYQARYFATQASEMLHVLSLKENLKF
jgi:hypothetical protein